MQEQAPPPAAAYDIVGDVHGCHRELLALLARLGYTIAVEDGRARVHPPPGRTAVFVGDLVDRGPNVPGVVELVMEMVADGVARCVLGNHEYQLLLQQDGQAPIAWGLQETLDQLAQHPPELLERLLRFARALPHQLSLDEGRLLVAHAGLPEDLQGLDTPPARRFALYGNPTSTRRLDWPPDYHGAARVVYGHTPTDTPTWRNRTLCIDTGCVYGGRLTALRYPELELVSIEAERAWYLGD